MNKHLTGMFSTVNRTKELLLKYLAKDLTVRESIFFTVKRWFSSGFRQIVHQFSSVESIAKELSVFSRIDNEAGWDKVKQKMAAPKAPVPITGFTLNRAFTRYAAVLLLAFTVLVIIIYPGKSKKQMVTVDTTAKENSVRYAGIYQAKLLKADNTVFYLDSTSLLFAPERENAQATFTESWLGSHPLKQPSSPDLIYNKLSVPEGSRFPFSLPDNSLVRLYPASTITYPANFLSEERTVQLTGSAHFTVNEWFNPATGAKAAFKIIIPNPSGNTDPFIIKVLGTDFYVSAYPEENKTSVTLNKGSLAVIYKNDSFLIKPGQQAFLTTNDTKVSIVNGHDNAFIESLQKGSMRFIGDSLDEVIHKINRWYGSGLGYDGANPSKTYSGTILLGITNLDEAIAAVEEHFDITLTGKK